MLIAYYTVAQGARRAGARARLSALGRLTPWPTRPRSSSPCACFRARSSGPCTSRRSTAFTTLACARGFASVQWLGIGVVAWVVGVATVIALLAAASVIVAAARQRRAAGSRRGSTAGVAALAALAIVWEALPAMLVPRMRDDPRVRRDRVLRDRSARAANPRARDTPPGGDAERGRLLLRQYGCGTCHRIPGVAAADGDVGPPLDRVARRVYLAGTLPNSPANMARFIRAPQVGQAADADARPARCAERTPPTWSPISIAALKEARVAADLARARRRCARRWSAAARCFVYSGRLQRRGDASRTSRPCTGCSRPACGNRCAGTRARSWCRRSPIPRSSRADARCTTSIACAATARPASRRTRSRSA